MPNYLYKCKECDAEEKMTLPLSAEPSLTYTCLRPLCNGEMSRRLVVSQFTMKSSSLGAWYKNETGKELLGGK